MVASGPIHTTLLGSEIPIIEHLTNLEELPDNGFTFTAVPPKIEGAGHVHGPRLCHHLVTLLTEDRLFA